MKEQPTLETERLLLRPLEFGDAPRIQALASDRQIAATTLNIPYPYPEGGAEMWIQQVLEHRARGDADCTFGILRKTDNVLMGAVGIHPYPSGFRAELGYWIGVDYWGQGYMTEAVRRVIQYGFEELGLHRIDAWHFMHNPASGRVMQKAGMTFEGIMRQHYFKWDEFVDIGGYSILRAEFEGQKTS
jgi:RimJ/RimL family protein N-acetyltransferase